MLYLFVIIALLLLWSIPTLILWLVFDIPFPISLTFGVIGGSFLLALLDVLPLRRLYPRKRKGPRK